MLLALALVLAAVAPPEKAPPAVAVVPLRSLGVPPDLQRALQETLRNEVAALPEARLVPESALSSALAREPDCESRVPCAAAAASKAGAGQLIIGTASALGDAFMIDLKLLDARSAQELGRATHPVSGTRDALIETLHAAAVELLAPARYAGALRIDVPEGKGADIYVDGKAVGKAPLAAPIASLTPGQHTVRVAGPRDTSRFVEVRFGRTTDVRVDLAPRPPDRIASPVLLATQPSAPARPLRPPTLRIAGLAGLGLSAASLVAGIAFHARAYVTAGDLNRREEQNALSSTDLAAYGSIDNDVKRARGFYIAAGALGAIGGALLLWDLHLDHLAVGPGTVGGRF